MYRWIRQGVIPTIGSQGRYRFDRKELEAWARYKRISGEAAATGHGTSEVQPTSIAEALTRGGVHPDLKDKNPKEIFDKMVQQLPFIEEIEPDLQETLARELLEREALVSTGVGDGVALPHPRHPREWGLGSSAVAIYYLNKPIKFNAIDGKPVHVLILLLCDSVKAHLQMLSQIAHLLKDEGLTQFLQSKPSSNALMEFIQNAQTGQSNGK